MTLLLASKVKDKHTHDDDDQDYEYKSNTQRLCSFASTKRRIRDRSWEFEFGQPNFWKMDDVVESLEVLDWSISTSRPINRCVGTGIELHLGAERFLCEGYVKPVPEMTSS